MGINTHHQQELRDMIAQAKARAALQTLLADCEAFVDAERPEHWQSCPACCLGIPHKHIPVTFDVPRYELSEGE